MATLDDAVPLKRIENETELFAALQALGRAWAKAQAAALAREIDDAHRGIMRGADVDPPGALGTSPPPASESAAHFENEFTLKFWNRLAATLACAGMGPFRTAEDVVIADAEGIHLLALNPGVDLTLDPAARCGAGAVVQTMGSGGVSGQKYRAPGDWGGSSWFDSTRAETAEPLVVHINGLPFDLPVGTLLRSNRANFEGAGLRLCNQTDGSLPRAWKA